MIGKTSRRLWVSPKYEAIRLLEEADHQANVELVERKEQVHTRVLDF